MFYVLIALHVLVALFLILVVLLQTGKGADIGSAFGGGSSQTVFGSRGGATIMHKITTVAAVAFMVTSLVLAILSSRMATSVIKEEPKAAAPAATQTAPVAPAPLPATPREAPKGGK